MRDTKKCCIVLNGYSYNSVYRISSCECRLNPSLKYLRQSDDYIQLCVNMHANTQKYSFIMFAYILQCICDEEYTLFSAFKWKKRMIFLSLCNDSTYVSYALRTFYLTANVCRFFSSIMPGVLVTQGVNIYIYIFFLCYRRAKPKKK